MNAKIEKTGPTFVIPPADVRCIELTIQGVDPGLLMNPFGRKAKQQLLDAMQPKKARNVRKAKDLDAEYAERLAEVTIEEGVYGMSVLAFKNALVRGAKVADKLAMTDMRAGLFAQNDSFTEDGTPVVRVMGTPVMDVRHVRNKSSADLRTRVLLKDWTCSLRLMVTEQYVSVEQVVMCAVNAGVGVGVGDWRPEKSGVHGRWEVLNVGELTLKAG